MLRLSIALLVFAVLLLVLASPSPAAERFAGSPSAAGSSASPSQNPYALLTKPKVVRGLAAGIAITAGAVGVGVQVSGPGEPAPQSSTSRALPSGALAKGGKVPAGTAIVRKTVALGRTRTETATLPCPSGLRVADLIGARGASASYARGTVVGMSAVATVLVQPRPVG